MNATESQANEKYYMHKESGDVATELEWRADYDAMDIETWFGVVRLDISDEMERCWLLAGGLIEVEKGDNGEWVEV